MQERQAQTPEQVIDYKVKRKLAQTAVHSIHDQTQQIQLQIESEKRYSRFLLPIIFSVLIGFMLYVLYPLF